MYSEERKQTKPINIIVLGVIATLIILIILICVTIFRSFHDNPYGSQIVISNIDEYYKDFDVNEKDLIYHYLYNIVSLNVSEGASIPNNGAVIRNGSANKEHNAVEGIETGSFIVDIESLKQSYGVQFTWVVEETSNYDNGYPVIVRCLSQEEQIYDFDNCVNMFEDDSEKYPITKDLPIVEQYYTSDYSVFVDYIMMYEIVDNKLTIIIRDNSGDSYEYALAKIRELGYNPDEYNIKYENKSSSFGN